ncbi:MAG: photosynthetic complex assembly protein PuhC [Pseudomonadota bacterium]
MERRDKEMVPRVLLRAVGLLVAASLLITVFARLTDQPLAAMPPDIPIIEERVLIITGSMSGAATVTDAQSGELIADLDATEGGFVAGIWRTMRRERGKYGVDPSAPIRLVRFQDGHIALRDDLTPWRAELIGFGVDNTAVFMRLLKSKQNQG